jgi:ATPase family associated with various cellular activities (AAA)
MIDEALALGSVAGTYLFSRRVAEKHAGAGIVEGDAYGFDPFGFAASGACTVEPAGDEYLQLATEWNGERAADRPANGAFGIAWDDVAMDLYWFTPSENRGPYFALVAERRADALRFFETVCRWTGQPDGEILVFHAGQWIKDERLFASIRDATFDNLVMPAAEKAEIAGDAQRFFASRDRYARYKVPWKRGVLFAGPPGNGKTHAVKAIVRGATVPCIYVRSFDLPGHPFPGAGIAMVFERARTIAPCILVLEDLDSLVGDDNRAYFLNDLDGFEQNDGILVLATTNHPERIDAAIVDRPSRFDRKYAFGLPAAEQRNAYVELWNADLEPELRLSPDDAAAITERTDGFSYAYLKELFVSSLMRWVGDESVRFGAHLLEQAEVLRGQLAGEPDDGVPVGPGPDFGWSTMMNVAARQHFARGVMHFGR